MTNLDVQSAKLAIVFEAGNLPDVDPADPQIVVNLDGVKISTKVNSKAARKLKTHSGGAILQGRLMVERGSLVLTDAGFQFLESAPKPSSLPSAPKEG
jgi:hypothetical protein